MKCEKCKRDIKRAFIRPDGAPWCKACTKINKDLALACVLTEKEIRKVHNLS